jgi:imidazole glycerol-phosphate synthase subunit HisH
MIGVIDSKICNIFSLTNMLKKLNAEFTIIDSSEQFDKIDKIILPGVGAFPKAIDNLKKFGFYDKIIEFGNKGVPILGICLGMQLLFEESEEFEIVKGLGLISGKIIKIKTSLPLPHMGWNDLTIIKEIPLLKNVKTGADVYFVHSFRAQTDNKFVAATTEYEEIIPAVIFKDNIYGCQFHPEKSQKWGEIIMSNFMRV